MPRQSNAADRTIMPADRPYSDALSRMARLLSDAVTRVMPNSDADWQTRITPAIEATLARFELVPREEFERHVAEIERLQGEVAKLEARIDALERHG
jgi:BMFP domain-containing protein YqiC